MDAREIINTALAIGTASAFAQAVRMLASKGHFTAQQVEILRHSALLGFDEVRERKDLSRDVLEEAEKARGALEEVWQRAVLAAEKRA